MTLIDSEVGLSDITRVISKLIRLKFTEEYQLLNISAGKN